MKREGFMLPVFFLLALAVGLVYAPVTLAHGHAGGQAPAVVGWPASMASTGDSITRAYNTGSSAFSDAPENSWSTGTTVSVNSHYTRIVTAFPSISSHNYNDAVTGAKMTGLAA